MDLHYVHFNYRKKLADVDYDATLDLVVKQPLRMSFLNILDIIICMFFAFLVSTIYHDTML